MNARNGFAASRVGSVICVMVIFAAHGGLASAQAAPEWRL